MKGYSLKQRLLSKITIETELINEILQQLENHYQNGESATVILHQNIWLIFRQIATWISKTVESGV